MGEVTEKFKEVVEDIFVFVTGYEKPKTGNIPLYTKEEMHELMRDKQLDEYR